MELQWLYYAKGGRVHKGILFDLPSGRRTITVFMFPEGSHVGSSSCAAPPLHCRSPCPRQWFLTVVLAVFLGPMPVAPEAGNPLPQWLRGPRIGCVPSPELEDCPSGMALPAPCRRIGVPCVVYELRVLVAMVALLPALGEVKVYMVVLLLIGVLLVSRRCCSGVEAVAATSRGGLEVHALRPQGIHGRVVCWLSCSSPRPLSVQLVSGLPFADVLM